MASTLRLPSDPQALDAFASDLASFTVDAVAQRMGDRARAGLDREDTLPADLALRGETDSLALLIRLFLLFGELKSADLNRALPTSAEAVRSWGVVIPSGNGSVRAGVDLRPTMIGENNAWLAADLGESATGKALDEDHVLGLGGASATLVDLTVRKSVDRVLDLGTGSGIQTLGLVHHASHVLATDISARALQFAAFNLALNDRLAAINAVQSDDVRGHPHPTGPRGRVELRKGSFFEAVDGDFDLIVSNPPFVVSPRSDAFATYTYRDGGFEGDGVIQHLLQEAPSRLRPGGIAQILGNWEIHRGQEWHDRIGTWARATGLDAWVVQREYLDPAHYVHTWLRDGGLTPERDPAGYRNAYEQWLRDMDARGVEGIGFGYVILRRPLTARDPWIRLEEITGTLHGGLGEAIGATLEVVETLARTSQEELRTWHLEVSPDVTEERYYRPGAGDPDVIILRQGGGFSRAAHVGTLVAGLVGACDGELSLGEIIDALATLLGVDAALVAQDVLPTTQGLLMDGLLVRRDGATVNSDAVTMRGGTGSDTLIS